MIGYSYLPVRLILTVVTLLCYVIKITVRPVSRSVFVQLQEGNSYLCMASELHNHCADVKPTIILLDSMKLKTIYCAALRPYKTIYGYMGFLLYFVMALIYTKRQCLIFIQNISLSNKIYIGLQ